MEWLLSLCVCVSLYGDVVICLASTHPAPVSGPSPWLLLAFLSNLMRVWVPKVAEKPDLSQHLLGLVRVVEDLSDPLDRHRLSR